MQGYISRKVSFRQPRNSYYGVLNNRALTKVEKFILTTFGWKTKTSHLTKFRNLIVKTRLANIALRGELSQDSQVCTIRLAKNQKSDRKKTDCQIFGCQKQIAKLWVVSLLRDELSHNDSQV